MSLEQQHEASDPGVSVWVDASAGAGKTKILTDRVLRLLLTGIPPERILCLTFTKAAAAEMAGRITSRLSEWSLIDDRNLCDDLFRLSGQQANQKEMERARGLFSLVVDSTEKLQVETIHGFCQSLLRRFPLEAKLSPQFDVIDDYISKEYLKVARELIIRKAISEGVGPHNAPVSRGHRCRTPRPPRSCRAELEATQWPNAGGGRSRRSPMSPSR